MAQSVGDGCAQRQKSSTIWGQLGVLNRVLNVAVTQIRLQGTRVVTFIGQREAAGVPQHVRSSAAAPARSTSRAKPAVVNGAPRSEVCGVAIPGPGDYVRVWRSRELKRSGKLSYADTLSTELTGSTTPAAAILSAACRLRRRW